MLGFPPQRSDSEALYFPLNNKRGLGSQKVTFVLLLRLYTQQQLYFQRLKYYCTCLFFFLNLMLNSYACRTGRQPPISVFRISIVLA